MNNCIVCNKLHNNKTFCSRNCQLKVCSQYFGNANERRRNGELPSGQLGKRHSEETKLKMSVAHKGKPHPFSDDGREKIKAAARGNTHGRKNKGMKRSIETRQQMSRSHLGVPLSDSHRASCVVAQRKVWDNTELHPNLKNCFTATRFNKFEQKILAYLQSISTRWRYVGDGELMVGRKCPDFWDGDKKLVEFYGEHWHKVDNSKERIEYFREYGYETLIVWGKELGNQTALLDKLRLFS